MSNYSAQNRGAWQNALSLWTAYRQRQSYVSVNEAQPTRLGYFTMPNNVSLTLATAKRTALTSAAGTALPTYLPLILRRERAGLLAEGVSHMHRLQRAEPVRDIEPR